MGPSSGYEGLVVNVLVDVIGIVRPAKKVQSILGHSSITMTMDVYGHLFESPEDDVEMFEKMEAGLMAV